MEKEAAALEDIEGIDDVVGLRGRAQAGLRHSRFAEWPTSLCRVAIVVVEGLRS